MTFLRYIPRVGDSSTDIDSFQSIQETIFSIGSLKKRIIHQTKDMNCRKAFSFFISGACAFTPCDWTSIHSPALHCTASMLQQSDSSREKAAAHRLWATTTIPPACSLLLALIWEALGKGDSRELTRNRISWSVRPHSARGTQLKCFCNVSQLGCWATADFLNTLFKIQMQVF